jgi:hypothetical protein
MGDNGLSITFILKNKLEVNHEEQSMDKYYQATLLGRDYYVLPFGLFLKWRYTDRNIR